MKPTCNQDDLTYSEQEIGADPQVGVNGPTAGQRWAHGEAEMDPLRGRGGPTAGRDGPTTGQRWTHDRAEMGPRRGLSAQ